MQTGSAQLGYMVTVALIAALGGFLMGFDASVISGVVLFIEPEFSLTPQNIGWGVASLTATATVVMLAAGPLSDRLGRRPVLKIAAALFAVSAVASALAPDFFWLVIARMLGGFGVGAALIVAPMYIAEIAPAKLRGRLVSFNQLNIVIGISAAYFSNYLIQQLGGSDLAWAQAVNLGGWNWRWMLAVEAVPAVIYFLALFVVPESPRWLVMHGRDDEALGIMTRVGGAQQARAGLDEIREALERESTEEKSTFRELFHPALRLVLTVGLVVGVLQQITGINAVFFYAPMIFEQSGIGTDASLWQAILIGLVNLVFTVLAILTIDRLGRRPLLICGLAGIVVSMLVLSWGFGAATYRLDAAAVASLPESLQAGPLTALQDETWDSDTAFREAVVAAVGTEAYAGHRSELVSAAISMNPTLILAGILGFVASFAMSLGPVMWVLFSELFPNRVRALAISFVGFVNSAVSFGVQFIFPWELEYLGNSLTFLIFAIFAAIGLVIVVRLVPETRGRSLDELQAELVRT